MPPHEGLAARARRNAADALQGLLDWAASAKVATDKLAAAPSLATGAPLLVAARDIAAGEAVLTVPDAHWITPAAVAKSPIGPSVSGLEPWLQLALLLVSERAAGAAAGALPGAFLAALPQALDAPLFWGDDEIDMLQGTQALQQLYGYRQFFQETFAELEATLFASDRALFPAEAFTYEAFLWAAATVRGRAHAPLDGAAIALVPLADGLPHRRGGNCAWKAKSSGLFGQGRVLTVEAARAIRKGEELTMDYGPGKLDSSLLVDYGVMDSSWPQGGYSLSLSVPDSDRYRDDKLDVLERNGLAGAGAFAIKKGEEPSREMLGFLRLTQLSGSDCFLLESIFEAEVWSFMCDPISPQNEAAVCSSCTEGVRAALAGYATAIEDDLAALRSGKLEPGSRQERAVQVRLGEKEALDSFLGWLETRVGQLPRLEYYQERRLKRLGLIDDNGDTTYSSFFKDGIA
ncbi:rubisco large subunit N-methyltransferase [Raphidocelis subcapitata]|uniref:Rubisco large subunit N-methyltransferase n=1 Tax=Raphidocelis subcapitata TaxID=307507 RepID=A0A2V0NVT2_9CHLO|nr:rubisco large subunit N-methyltransferase [Raphidocelis subcapitata]|eukprot:GBF89663.1 rubisco large subunit N-methyltransferase [Raphidocelis subcapitata]